MLTTAAASADDSPARNDRRREWPIALAIGLAALVLAYWPDLVSLVETWRNEPDYSHGFLVLPVALAILYRARPAASKAWSSPSSWGWGVVLGALALRTYWHESSRPWMESATLLPVIFGLALAMGGWRLLRWAWPGLAYLVFLFPLPGPVNAVLSQPLQRLATKATVQVLRLCGLWVMSEGNIINVGTERLEVATACNGLSMLMSLAATVVAMTLLVPMPLWRRLVLLASMVPIALTSNVLRITMTAWCYHRFGAEIGERYVHDWAGWLMMPTALVLVVLELGVLSWLFAEREDEVIDLPFAPQMNPGVRPKTS